MFALPDLYVRNHLADNVFGGDTIVVGDARGIDDIAARWVTERTTSVKLEVWAAAWGTHGKKAGFIRNAGMVESKPDLVLAYWDGVSKGTFHTMTLAHKKGIPIKVLDVERLDDVQQQRTTETENEEWAY